MKFTCAISGIEVSISDSLSVSPRKSGPLCHPIFYCAPEALWNLGGRAAAGELNSSELHLLTLALLNSTKLCTFRGTVRMNEASVAHWWNRTFKLCSSLALLNSLESFPRVVFSSEDGASEENLKHILETLEDSLTHYKNGKAGESRADEVSRKEQALERLVRNPHRDPSSYAAQLASWAEIAGSFPTFQITDPTGTSRSISSYWKEIIVHCTKGAKIMKLVEKDLEELETHCLENIPAGSLYSHRLFQILANARIKLGARWDFGDIDDLPPAQIKPFKLVASLGEAKEAKEFVSNAIAQAAPKKEDYATLIEWVRADIRFKLSNKL